MSATLASPPPVARLVDYLVHFLHGSLLSIGLAVIVGLAAAWLGGHSLATLPGSLSAGLGQASLPADAGTRPEAPAAAPDRTAVTAEVIARRYKVAQPVVEDIVRMVDSTARKARLDPLLILAMIGVESRYNPYSESRFGAQGLMQVIGRFHTDKYEPTPDGQALLDPETNIRVGVQILRDYLRRTGDLEAALKLYGGESDDSGVGYADKVLAEKEKLLQSMQRSQRG